MPAPGEPAPPRGLLARLGTPLVAPGRAFADAARAVGTLDAVLLLLAIATLSTLPALVRAALSVDAAGGGALTSAFTALVTAAGTPVLVRIGLGVVVIAGAGFRRPGVAFDLGGVAWVPYLCARLTGAVVVGAGALFGLSGEAAARVLWWADALGLVPAAVLAILAIRALRSGALGEVAGAPPTSSTRGAAPVGATLVVLLVALAAARGTFVVRHLDAIRPLATGARAPAFTLPRADGGGTDGPGAHAGHVLLIDFWATWCGPCRQSMPILGRLEARLGPRGFDLLSVNIEGAGAAGRAVAMARELGVMAPVIVDDGAVQAAYRVDVLPTVVLVDRAGRVRGMHIGMDSAAGYEKTLASALEALLDEPAP